MQLRIRAIRRTIAGVLLAALSAVPVSAASYLVNWEGGEGWSLSGVFSFSDALLGTVIDENDLDRLTFDVLLNGVSQGTANLVGAGAVSVFNFNSLTGAFLVGGSSGSTGQNWNYLGNGVGFGSGTFAQAVSVNAMERGRIDVANTTLVARRFDTPAVPLPAGAVLMLSGLGTFGLVLRRRRNRCVA